MTATAAIPPEHELNEMARKDIQALAKQHGIKANGKTSDMIEALLEYSQAQQSAPTDQAATTSRSSTPASAKAKASRSTTPIISPLKRLSGRAGHDMHDVVLAELEQRVQQQQQHPAAATMQTPQVTSKTTAKTNTTAVKASGGIRYKFAVLHQQQHDSEPSIVEHQERLVQRAAMMNGQSNSKSAADSAPAATSDDTSTKRQRDTDAVKPPIKKLKLSSITTPSISKPVSVFSRPTPTASVPGGKPGFALNDTFKVKQLKHQRQTGSNTQHTKARPSAPVGRNPLADTSNTEFVFNVAPSSSFAVGVKNAVVNSAKAVKSTMGALVRRLSGKGPVNAVPVEVPAAPQKFVSDKRTNELAERYRLKQAERQAQLKAMVYSREKQDAIKQAVHVSQQTAKQKVIAGHRRL